MSIALDIGTSRLRSLRRDGCALVGRSVASAFTLVADEPSARDLLARAEIAYASGEGELALVGDAALAHAAAFHAAPLRLMPGGLVATDDPPARQLLAALVESLLPETDSPGEPCGLILPAAAAGDEASWEFLSRLVRLRDYEPLPLTSAHAVALATLSGDGFTGIAFSLGAGGCEMSLVHRGRELVGVSEARGTDWIDARLAAAARRYTHDAAGERYLDSESIRRQREALADPLTRPTTDFAAQVAEQYRELLLATAKSLAERISAERIGSFAAPLPVVCAGGATRPSGFAGLMTAVLAAADYPVAVGPVRLASTDEYLVARGGLIHAELEQTCAAAA